MSGVPALKSVGEDPIVSNPNVVNVPPIGLEAAVREELERNLDHWPAHIRPQIHHGRSPRAQRSREAITELPRSAGGRPHPDVRMVTVVRELVSVPEPDNQGGSGTD